MTWENAACASGPLLVAWLEERHELPERLCSTMGDAFARRIQAWKAGHRAEFWTVDRMLTRLGLHVSMVPDEVWLEGDARHIGSPPIRSTRAEKVKLRFCKWCREEIPRATVGREVYSGRVFCSLECTRAAKGGWLSEKQRFPKRDAA